jgi:hypothetical protein
MTSDPPAATPLQAARDAEAESAVEAEREPNFLLARWERPTLIWLARRMPRWVLPDDLTILGVAAAFGVCAAYQLSNNGRADGFGWRARCW